MKKTYYVKQGRKYVPVEEYDSDLMDAMPYGTHLVQVREGGMSRRYNIDPDTAPYTAAALALEEKLTQIVSEAMDARPSKRPPLTDEQMNAWVQFRDAMGDQMGMLEYPSLREVAERFLKTLQETAVEQMNNPTVRNAYEKYLMLATLAKEAA